jgi:hypothetical protein
MNLQEFLPPVSGVSRKSKWRCPDEATNFTLQKQEADFTRKSAGLQNQNRFAVLVRARDCSGNPAGFAFGEAEELERKARFPAATRPEMRPNSLRFPHRATA